MGIDRYQMRSSEEDRLEVQDVLGDAFRQGRLSEEELSERLERLHASRTYGDLAALVEDLPCQVSFLAPESVSVIPTNEHLVRNRSSHRTGWIVFAVVMGLVLLGSPAGAGILIILPLSYLFFRSVRRSRGDQCC